MARRRVSPRDASRRRPAFARPGSGESPNVRRNSKIASKPPELAQPSASMTFDAPHSCARRSSSSARQAAMATLGGMCQAKGYRVECHLRECVIPRGAPVSPQMILRFIAEKVLGGLPKPY
ncbi:hypothetical protein WS69_24065 [Burkholderia sp. BDU5]|nr:hypothetical protein WS69_24065 [Burkholderia sp. BDU5]